MVQPFRAPTEGRDLRVAVVRSRFNEAVTERLLEGALEALRQQHVADAQLLVYEVPGAIELPGAADLLLRNRTLDALVCLGAVILGETRHFDYVCQYVTDGLLRVQLAHQVPIAFGILTTENREQALARSEPGPRNKGFEAALTALEMANFGKALHLPS